MTLAQQEAEGGGQSYIGTEHLLLGLMSQEDGLAHAALTDLELQLPALRASIGQVLGTQKRNVVLQIIPTSRVKRIIEMAFELARSEGSSHVDTGHLLIAIVAEGEGVAAHALAENAVTVDRVRDEIARLRQAGQAEATRTGSRPKPLQRRHLDVKDANGRTIAIDIRFPADYGDEQCNAAAARVEKAIRPSEE